MRPLRRPPRAGQKDVEIDDLFAIPIEDGSVRAQLLPNILGAEKGFFASNPAGHTVLR